MERPTPEMLLAALHEAESQHAETFWHGDGSYSMYCEGWIKGLRFALGLPVLKWRQGDARNPLTPTTVEDFE